MSDALGTFPYMSTRTRSGLGSLGERVRRPTTAFCLVDDSSPGLVMEWLRVADLWCARVAYLEEGALIVAVLPASRLRKASVGGE
ncbi:MAG: hypothetical protein ACYC1E_09730 [Propionibacteriaceae bacterium]